MRIHFISLFPNEMASFFNKGILGKARKNKVFETNFIQLRDFANPPHFKVDDYPYGHRKGMLLKVDVLSKAIESIQDFSKAKIIFPCPKGSTFNQNHAKTLSKDTRDIIFICGYYEGVDERLFDRFDIVRYSIGDVVLSSGELPALIMSEALLRCLPGVLGNPDSLNDDSILSGVLEHPQYSAPREFDLNVVPGVILSGDHGKIAQWQRKEALKQTLFSKPSLLSTVALKPNDTVLLTQLLMEDPT